MRNKDKSDRWPVTDAQDIRELLQSGLERERLLAEMQSVLAITRALVREIELNNLLEFIITQAEHLMNASGAAVLLLSEDGHELEMAASSASWLLPQSGTRIPLKDSLAEKTINSQQVQIVNQVHDDDQIACVRILLEPIEVQAVLYAPLVIYEMNLGVLLLWSTHPHSFTWHDSRLIGLFADQAALALHNAYLHAQNRQLIIQQERDRLARELHDSVTQSLYTIGLATQTILRQLDQPGNVSIHDQLNYIHTLSRTALTEMREHLYRLDSTILVDKNLNEIIAGHCDLLSTKHALTIEFKPSDTVLSLSLSQQEALYYIAREALWNVVKHASATQVKVSLTEKNGKTILSIIDNGIGFDRSAVDTAKAMGLRSITERAKLLGAILDLYTRPGQGTRLTIQMPHSAS